MTIFAFPLLRAGTEEQLREGHWSPAAWVGVLVLPDANGVSSGKPLWPCAPGSSSAQKRSQNTAPVSWGRGGDKKSPCVPSS